MAWTEADLAALDEAIKSGHLRVRYSDKEITYRTLAEMMQIKAAMQDALGIIPTLTVRSGRQTRVLGETGY